MQSLSFSSSLGKYLYRSSTWGPREQPLVHISHQKVLFDNSI
ncbi:hypothetical protein BVRB_2g031300 [Beta vulgaris subsp. vulgaris]|nr:hypothetical protein BVRB_2g031300 [Beta vulgaris subsp. vulgaris]